MPKFWVRWADFFSAVRVDSPVGRRPAGWVAIGIFLLGLRSGQTAAAALATSMSTSMSVPAPGTLVAERSVEELLAEARRTARLGSSHEREDPFRPIQLGGGLWAVRARFARIAAALSRPDPSSARAELANADASLLLLPDLAGFLLLSAERLETPEVSPSKVVSRLVSFAAAASSAATSEPLARAALKAASRRARTEPERRAVREGWERWSRAAPATPRAWVARHVGLSDLAASPKEALELLVELMRILPDAPERAADLFDPQERLRFDQAARSAPPAVRLARARSLGSRHADEALALIKDLAITNENRVAIAQIQQEAGRHREALALLDPDALARLGDSAEGLHAAVIVAISRVRLSGEGAASGAPDRPRRGGTRRGHRRGHRPLPLRGAKVLAIESPDGTALSGLLENLLSRPLSEPDRRRLLSEGLRFELRRGNHDQARGYLVQLLSLDPMTTAGAEDFFAEAFSCYQRARLAGTASTAELLRAARLWDEQGSLYRDVSVRRRTTYWSAKAHGAAGELATARSLYAGLLVGTSADLYGRWAAEALGVPLLPAPASSRGEEGEETLSGDVAGAPSRELLACGLPEIAEDAAEVEATLDPLFGAALASERGDYRRATSLLKARYPALGTPEEGGVPLSARRAYYPLLHSELLMSAAAKNGVSAPLLFGLIRQESLFQPLVRSRAGAIGLMQVMPATGRFLLRLERRRGRVDLTDPSENVTLGARYLAQLLAQFGGDAGAALAAYNAGPGRVRRWKKEGASLSPDEFIESIPLSEPRDYVKKVLFFQGAYASLYAPSVIHAVELQRESTTTP